MNLKCKQELNSCAMSLPLFAIRRCLLFFLLFLSIAGGIEAQRFMQIERYGSPKTQRIYPGTVINYRYQGSWYEGEIKDFRFDLGQLVLHNRYLPVAEIEALRYPRPGVKAFGRRLLSVGAIWTGGHLLAEATDGRPGVRLTPFQIGAGAATLLPGAYMTGFAGKYKIIEMGKRRRLRLMDLTF